MNFDTELSRLKKDIEQKLNWGPSSQWSNREFEKLSEMIQQKSGVALSHTTLKRILGKVRYESKPSITSLDALVQFIGWESWRAYSRPEKVASKTSLGWIKWAVGVLVLVFLVLGFTVFKPKPEVDLSNLPFSSKITSNEYPNTVLFDLDIPEDAQNEFSIQLFWDPTRTVDLKAGQQNAAGIYYYPGYFRAKLLADEEILQEHDVYLTAENWMATIDERPIPLYVSDQIQKDNSISISEEVLDKMSTYAEPTNMTYHWVQPTELDADNFRLETRIQHTLGTGSAVCQTFRLYILTTKSAIIIPFTKPGCVSEIGLMVSEKFLSGREHDLTAFSYDPSKEAAISVSVENQVLTVFYEDEQVYQIPYEKSLGEIAGFRFSFLGSGMVNELQVNSGSNTLSLVVNP